MEREQMKLAILKQEQTFRQQVHELHRLYHIQKQLMHQMQPGTPSCAPAVIIDVKQKPEFQIIHREMSMNPQQFFSFSNSKDHAPAPAEDFCSLELTLATGPSSSSSSGNAGRRQQAKRFKTSSNSDSGTTAVSSTSTESESVLLGEVDVIKTKVMLQSEARIMNEMGQGRPWMYQCLSLKTT